MAIILKELNIVIKWTIFTLQLFHIWVIVLEFPWQIHVLTFFSAFLMGPQNFRSLKYWANDEPRFMTGLFYSNQDIAKNLTKGQFEQNLQNGSDIYEYDLIN